MNKELEREIAKLFKDMIDKTQLEIYEYASTNKIGQATKIEVLNAVNILYEGLQKIINKPKKTTKAKKTTKKT